MEMNSPVTPWERELLQAGEKIRLIEREKALRDIAVLMRRYEITADELEAHMLDGAGAGRS